MNSDLIYWGLALIALAIVYSGARIANALDKLNK